MKRYYTFIIFLLSAFMAGAQTNQISSSGSVGIGTTSPNATLQVVSSGNNGVVVGTSSYPSWMGTNGLFVDGSLRAGNYLVNSGSAINWGASQAYIFGYNPSTGSNTFLSFGTGAAERLRIDNAGNIGIGTTAPQNKLHIAANSTDALRFSRTDATYPATLQYDGFGSLDLYTANAGGVLSTTVGLHIQSGLSGTAGNVGLGTTAPAAKLSIQGTYDVPGLALTNTADTHDNYSLSTQRSDGTYKTQLVVDDFGGLSFKQSHGAVNDFSALTTSFQIRNNGNVGIGTGSPDEKLSVLGKIHANEIKVDLSVPGPDYVFSPGYRPLTLDEIKAYVEKNRHLPEIRSADELAEKGIDLGEMNTKLLKKVEELTLYLIEQKEEIELLKQKINAPSGSSKR